MRLRISTTIYQTTRANEANLRFARYSSSKKRPKPIRLWSFLVLETGIEPVRYRYRGILSPLRLPVPPLQRNLSYSHIIPLVFFVVKQFLSVILQKNNIFLAFYKCRSSSFKIRLFYFLLILLLFFLNACKRQ